MEKIIKEELQSRIKGIVNDNLDFLTPYGNDASIFEIIPDLVIIPNDISDLKSLVNFINEKKDEYQNLSITPRAAGTGMSGESLTSSIVVDMAKFNHLDEIRGNQVITEPGVYYRDLEVETSKKGLLLPCYTASKKICTVGGMVANNSAGEKTLSYGSTAHYVEELTMLLSDGHEYFFKALNKDELEKKMLTKDFIGSIYKNIYNLVETNYDFIQSKRPQVSKNVSGYALWDVWDRTNFNLTKLFTGSEGTLGIITKIKFNLVRPKLHAELLVIFLNDLSCLGDITNTILTHNPESFESYDDRTINLARQFLPEIMHSLDESTIKSKMVLLAEFTGETEEEVIVKAQNAKKDIVRFSTITTTITRDQEDADKYWTVRRESFNLLRYHNHDHQRITPIIEDIIVAPEYLPEFLPQLYTILDSYNLIYTIAGHIGNGNLHIMPLMDLRETRIRDIAIELCNKVFDLVFRYHGSMSAEHNDGIIRTPFLEHMYGPEMVILFEKIKNIFDPKNIFNPNKKVFGKDLSFIKEHIDRVY
ncbi:FAD-binding oxidoreductase [Candidatus Azambacteria bacterium]|nr:FAD-binding oxidoreductase [Candidatus Azambacteria bacterium]